MVHPGLKRILVVDDNDVVRDVLHDFLSPLYHVDGATTAVEALDVVNTEAPDLILLDVRLEGEDGITLLKTLREKGFTMPVIVITGYGASAAAEAAERFGVAASLDKPFNLLELERLIADVMRGRGPRGS